MNAPSADPSQTSIVRAGFPVLRSPAEPIPVDRIGTPEIQTLIDRMVRAMREAPGVGLAAPQVGVGYRLLVMEDRDDLMARLPPEHRAERQRVPVPLTVVINPRLEIVGEERATFFEGCLSVPGYMALVERHLEVRLEGLDRNAKPIALQTRGWPARILQHEVDHLDGTLYVDRMLTRSFFTNEEVQARWLRMPVTELRAKLKI